MAETNVVNQPGSPQAANSGEQIIEHIDLTKNTHKKPSSNNYLKKCFQTLIDRKQLFMAPAVTMEIYKSDLNIPLSEYDDVLQGVLLESIVYFMVVWPGWKNSVAYFKGQLRYKDFYEEFKQYLITQLKEVIANEETYKKKSKRISRTTGVDQQTQTEAVSDTNIKPECDFGLQIDAAPKDLNSLVFFASEKDIVLKKYSTREWEGLTFQQLLNYPHFGIQVKMMDLSFSRVNDNDYSRYLSYSDKIPVTPSEEHVASVRAAKDCNKQYGYSCDYIREYVHQYIEVLARRNKNISSEDILDLSKVCNELINDIEEININNKSMATNTVVKFNIGGLKYVRNKKMATNLRNSKMQSKPINYCETIIPKMTVTLEIFNAIQDMNADKISFLGLNSVYADNSKKLPPKLVYMCTFCKLYFYNKQGVINHFKEEHGAEQPVLCFKCKKQFEIPFLAGNRWKHECLAVD